MPRSNLFKIFLLFLILTSPFAFSTSPQSLFSNSSGHFNLKTGSQETPTKLKIKQPNWRFEIIESYHNKQPKKVLFFEPLALQDQDSPVKLLNFSPSGLVESETDIVPLVGKEFSKDYTEKDYIKHGPSISYNSAGAVETVFFYNLGILQDSIKSYYPNGVLHTYHAVKDNILDGPVFKHHSNGELSEKGNYAKGNLNGPYEKYNKYGKKIASCQYDNGLLNGEVLEWFDDGPLKARVFYSKGLLNGDKNHSALTRYHQNGTLAETLDFQFGQPNGPHVRYFSEGKKEQYRAFYADGKKHGFERLLAIDGKILFEGEFKHGKPIGLHLKKDISGRVIFTATFDETGRTLEAAEEFFVTGLPKAEYFLIDDMLEGPYIEWYASGKVAKKLNYKNGDLEGLQEEYYDGSHGKPKLKLSVTYKDAEKQGLYEEWTDNGTPKASIYYDKGKKVGDALTWHLNGQKKTKTTYLNDSFDGPYQEWNEQGTLILETSYLQGKENGNRTEWHENGTLKSKATFQNGVLHGTLEEFHPNGQKSECGLFENGIADGEHCNWFEDGNLQEIHRYSKGLSTGECIIYHPEAHDKQQIISRIINYQNGKLHGEQKSFYPDGKKQALMTYKDGQLIGKKILWSDRGIVLEEGDYNEFGLHGRYYLQKPDGKEFIYHYKNNVLDGIHQIYYPLNSNLGSVKAFEANYVNGLLEDLVSEYNENGIKIKSTLYREGLKDGLAKIYSDDGRLKIAAMFHKDNQNGMAYEYYTNGNIKKQVLFSDDKKTGEEKMFFPNQEVAAITNYQDGKLHGSSYQWNEEGSLIFEAEYKDGLKHGKFNKYDDDGKPLSLQTYANDKLLIKDKK